VIDLLEVLDDRERQIIFQRFGLDGGQPKTLEEVAKKFGVTRERIRQLQNIALAKLCRALSKKDSRVPHESSPIAERHTSNAFCNVSEFEKKAKCARSSESLSTGLLCNQCNPECAGKSAIGIRAKFRGYLKQKTIVNL